MSQLFVRLIRSAPEPQVSGANARRTSATSSLDSLLWRCSVKGPTKLVRLGVLIALLLSGRPVVAAAQRESRYAQAFLGVTAASFRTPHPEGGTGGVGGLMGLERHLSDRASVRAVATTFHSVATTDGIALCHPRLDGTCLPDSVFPTWFSTLEVQGVMTPIRGLPIRIVGGGGLSHARDPKETRKSAPVLSLGSRTQALWRAGLDLSLGASRRAPRIEVTRTGFGSAPYSMSFVDAVSLVVRP